MLRGVYKGFRYSVSLSSVSVFRIALFFIDLLAIFCLMLALFLYKGESPIFTLSIVGSLIGLFLVVTPMIALFILFDVVRKYKIVFYTISVTGSVLLIGYIVSSIYVLNSLNPVLDIFRIVFIIGFIGLILGAIVLLMFGLSISKSCSGDMVHGVIVGYMPYSSWVVYNSLLSTGINVVKRYRDGRYYAMQVRYFYRGLWYTNYDSFAYSYRDMKPQGDSIDLYVDKYDPNKIYIPVVNYKYFYVTSVVLFILSTLFLAVDIVLWFV